MGVGASQLAWGLRRARCSPEVSLGEATSLIQQWGSSVAVETVGRGIGIGIGKGPLGADEPHGSSSGRGLGLHAGADDFDSLSEFIEDEIDRPLVVLKEPVLTFGDLVKLCSSS